MRGEPTDHRADIFAFGALLYEMLSGTRAFRRNTPFESMNAVLSDELAGDRGWVVRFYFNPLVRLIWLGALVMALGGALSLSDRRLRIGAPKRARQKAVAVASAAG